MSRFDHKPFGLILLLAGAAFPLGCDHTSRGTPEIAAPAVGTARLALIATLDAWKSGKRDVPTIGSKPEIAIVDSLRPGRPLVDYEVSGALAVVDKVRPFVVRLELDAPRETINTRYYVLGADPLFVFRQEDFEMMVHWEHKMPPIAPAESARTADDKPPGPGGR